MSDVDDFDGFVKVKDLNVKRLDSGETRLIRLRYDGDSFAHIEVRNAGGAINLAVYQIGPDNERQFVKFVPGLVAEAPADDDS